MMGYQSGNQPKLFYPSVNLEERIPENHVLRRIKSRIDFDFIYDEVRGRYGEKGNVSVPPPVILKMMLLLILYNVRSERELMTTIALRLDWIWFLGYDLDSEIPDHSVLSKARSRWGVEAFKNFFERIVWQCVEAGLVDGTKLFMDSSLVQADAANTSVIKSDALKIHLARGYQELEARLDEKASPGDESKSGAINRRYLSTTDPDASVNRQGAGQPKLQYKVHRGVDEKHEVITATEVTPGEVNEAHQMLPLLEDHQKNTEKAADTVVADTKYGTVENYLSCYELGLQAHIPDLKSSQETAGQRKGVFSDEAFTYDPESDTYRCPAGHIMTRRRHKKKREALEYACGRRICKACDLRDQCTRSVNGRSIKRHLRQEELNRMREHARSAPSRRDLRARQHLMERSFAQATRYGFKRARWRRLWRVQIQEYLTAAIQDILILLCHVKEPCSAMQRLYAGTDKTRVGLGRWFLKCEEVFFELWCFFFTAPSASAMTS